MICTNCAREIKGEVAPHQTEFVVAEKDKEKKWGITLRY